MADQKSRRTTMLLAIWFLAGWATTVLTVRFFFGPYVDRYADPTQPSKTLVLFGLTLFDYGMTLSVCLIAGCPIFFWPRITRRMPIWETSWGGNFRWLAIWFPACLFVAILYVIVQLPGQGNHLSDGKGFGGGFAIAILMAVAAMSFVAIWVLPRLLMPWLWLGAFAAPDGDARESATDPPADSEG